MNIELFEIERTNCHNQQFQKMITMTNILVISTNVISIFLSYPRILISLGPKQMPIFFAVILFTSLWASTFAKYIHNAIKLTLFNEGIVFVIARVACAFSLDND